MEYDSITIDTNVFDRNGLNLEGGMLGQLSQFRDGPTRFVLSEIVVREVRKHLVDKAKEATNSLAGAIKDVVKQKVASEVTGKQLSEILESFPQQQDIVGTRLNSFIETTGANVVSADSLDIKDLIKCYFSSLPPFEETGKKKNEFPDAIILLSLEEWAKTNQQKILAISHDKGWANFASDSEWIDVEDDFAAALERIQTRAHDASEFMIQFVADLEHGNTPDMMEEIDSNVGYVVSGLIIDANANSSYYYELEDSPDLEYNGLLLRKSEGTHDVKVVHAEQQKIVSKLGLLIPIKATANFLFEAHLSEGEHLDLGNAYYTAEADLNAEILVTLEGDFAGGDGNFEITDIEMTYVEDAVDFGEINPNFGDWHSD
ncbi:MAG: PIN domain-containing protein [Gammaproteobacteria bacterium]|nr:PIN domain-containing protein [Gammaproteobacteria bacterium]